MCDSYSEIAPKSQNIIKRFGLSTNFLKFFTFSSLFEQVPNTLGPGVTKWRLVWCLAGRLVRRVVYNLLGNAIKYTGPGGRVEVTSAADGDSLTVKDSDTGIGIPPEHLSQVFERFYRADPSCAGDRPGAGLGLAICNSIVRTLGGSILWKAARAWVRRYVSSCRSTLPSAIRHPGPIGCANR